MGWSVDVGTLVDRGFCAETMLEPLVAKNEKWAIDARNPSAGAISDSSTIEFGVSLEDI
jgi:hypothetical protein